MSVPVVPTGLNQIIEVLLTDGKWYRMESESFRLFRSVFRDGEGNPIAQTGALHFCFIPSGGEPDEIHGVPPMIHGPFSSIQAYRTDMDFGKN